VRRVATVLAAGLLAGGTGFLVATPADAATLSTAGYNPETRTITATAQRAFAESVTLTISGPTGVTPVSASKGSLDSNALTLKRTGIVLNGVYRAVVTSLTRPDDSATITVADPPATPRATSAPGGAGVATVRWNDNAEPDFLGYAVVEGGVTVKTLSGSCGGPCSTTLTDLAPGAHSFSVVATRSNGTGGQISAASAPTSVTVAAPPPPPTTEPPATTGPSSAPSPGTSASPTPAPSSDPGGDDDGDGTLNGVDDTPGTPTPAPSSSVSPGASGSPSASPSAASGVIATTPRRGTATFGGFSGFGTALSVPGLKLGVVPPSLAGGKTKVPDGTYDPELAYGSEIRETSVAGSESGGNALGPIGDAIDSEQLMRTLAAALILLLAGAHLRRWLSDSAGTGH
jgi:hypothetical protein